MKAKANSNRFISSKDIQAINEATIVLRHFIGLNAKLLPILNEISEKKELSAVDIQNRDKILAVFYTYKFETDTSEMLMNSDILSIIKRTFLVIEKHLMGEPTTNNKELIEVLKAKYQEMNHEWIQTELN